MPSLRPVLLLAILLCGMVSRGRGADSAPSAEWILAEPGVAPALYVDSPDQNAVVRAAGDFAQDVERVSGQTVRRCSAAGELSGGAVIVGVLGHSPLIDRLVAEGRLDVSGVKGQWESNVTTVVPAPIPGLASALVIAGSDRRGAIYGLYGISEEIGVSPWAWWADVPVPKRVRVGVRAGRRIMASPAVRYRGIFLNDEDWGLRVWASQTFDPKVGNIGPKTYARIFELLLRLRANTLWPAMHPGTKSFNSYPDDKIVADEYGIVMGSSHAEPMLRDNIDEWHHETQGDFDYGFNRDNVLKYWDDRVRENARFENIFTLGMRGIHDGPMQGGGTIDERATKLAAIMRDQRAMIAKWVNPAVEQVPQMFCPYKEVLPIYEHAPAIVPSDVTLVWPDENFGYIQHFSSESERRRSGGAGVYYHVSYWGRPYDYLWICSTAPAQIAEEMEKAYAFGAKRIWILNVGDLKPAEIDMEFFLRLAWDPSQWKPEDGQHRYLVARIARDIGSAHAEEIAAILDEYYRLNFWRKPEHVGIDPKFPLLASPQFAMGRPEGEGQVRLRAFDGLANRAKAVRDQLPPEVRDTYFEYVYYPVVGAALMNTKGLNLAEYQRLAATQGVGVAREFLAKAQAAQATIDQLTAEYNDTLASGKWKGMMSDAPRGLAVFDPPRALPAAGTHPVGVVAPEPEADSRSITLVASSATGRVAGTDAQWTTVHGMGYTGSVVVALPETAPPRPDLPDMRLHSPRLEFAVTLAEGGKWDVIVQGPPTWPVDRSTGVRYAVAFDDEAPQVITRPRYKDEYDPTWQKDVLRNAAYSISLHAVTGGKHTLKLWRIDPGLVLDSILVAPAGVLKGGYEWPVSSLAP